MTPLIAMPGPQPGDTAAAASAPDQLPALPEFSGMLDRARRLPDVRDWRSGVLAALGADGNVGPAAIAARALPALAPGSALCFATPLHVVAGISRVHLPPGGWLRLDAAESENWRQAFNDDFGGPDLHLHAVGTEWLLATPDAVAASDAAPEQLIGQPLARAPARDDAQRALRRLGAEIEIWLASHALNRTRELRNLAPINSFWLWGGARAAQIAPFRRSPTAVVVAGDPDAWVIGLAAHCSLPLVTASNWKAMPPGSETLLVLPPPRSGMSATSWELLESAWLAPAARALRSGEIAGLRLQIGASTWQLPDRSLLRWLRRRRAWHERVAA